MDVGFSPAECVYGMKLVLPGQLSPVLELPDSRQPLHEYTAQLKADMEAARCPESACHTAAPRIPVPPALRDVEHVFVRHGARPIPLTRPYDGPFRVVRKEDKFFVIKVGAKEQVILVDRMKPAFGFADPAPAVPGPRSGRPLTRPRVQQPRSR